MNSMIIGIPTESWRDEQRVALIPAGVFALVKAGHKVIVQANAGLGCDFTNEAYDEAGATLVFNPSEIFERADLIVKVMPPSLNEVESFVRGKTIFSFFNFDIVNARLMSRLIENQTPDAEPGRPHGRRPGR